MSKPKGIYCPNCRGVRMHVTHVRHPCPGLKVRYLRCVVCGERAKTEERPVPTRRRGS